MHSYLPQSVLVEELLRLVSEIIPNLPEGEFKQKLLNCVEKFEFAITPSIIYLDEVYQKTTSQDIVLSREEAIQILNNAAQDIDSNYVSVALQYHIDEYLCSTLNPS